MPPHAEPNQSSCTILVHEEHNHEINETKPQSKQHQQQPQQRKSVSFHDTLHISEYPVVIGDNPGCSSGAPISLDWEPQQTIQKSLDDFETIRQPKRRRQRDLAIPATVRRERLLQSGFTSQDVDRANMSRIQDRRKRKETVENLNLDDACILARKVLWKLPKKGFVKLTQTLTHRRSLSEKTPSTSFKGAMPAPTRRRKTTLF
jgi:hypothetical protein